ncbi:MAG: 7-cyano-7-deazaguanine synthase QueC [Phycisphaerae bacterium]|jgi:7-cyano-7-deazaguanine synthase|nr:7-cyano-7-deazaguanine synthase QueC [Phycisphaerae bacterium]MDP7636594.1 7-cyano-7-deazaguanine synthase QueC [Phycisphaerae bacterium]
MTDTARKTAVVLVSGGLDSATTLAIARREGYTSHALSFDYSQRHRYELGAARRVAEAMGAACHRVVKIDLSASGGFGRSALTDEIAVPTGGENTGGIPPTYVPARNTIFLSLALGYAEVIGSFDIFIGVNAVDYSGYPDCREEFVKAFEAVANLATAAADRDRGRFTIHAPLMWLTKAQIIRRGVQMGVDYSLTHSCYDPAEDGAACGRCDSCRLRAAGFRSAGLPDPTRYARSGNR